MAPGNFTGDAWRVHALADFIISAARGRTDLERATFEVPEDLDVDQVKRAALLPTRSPLREWDLRENQEPGETYLYRAGTYLCWERGPDPQ